jgi:FixJ family two-component response regulator
VVVWPFDAACIDGLIAASRRRHHGYVRREVRDAFTEIAHPGTPWNRDDEICWQTVLGAQPKDIAADRGIKNKTVYGIRDRARHRLHVASISDLREQVLQSVLPDWRTKK